MPATPSTPSTSTPATVAVLGAGQVGRTLAIGWLRSGHRVMLGSREPGSTRVLDAVAGLRDASGGEVTATGHRDAALAADVTVITVPGQQVAELIGVLGDALAGRAVIDVSNDTAATDGRMNAVADLRAAGAVTFRAFNSVGWEQLQSPMFGRLRADMPYTGPAGPETPVIEGLITDIGFRAVHLGDSDAALGAVDALARLWFLLAFGQGYGRRLGFRLLTAADDEPVHGALPTPPGTPL